MLSPGKYLLYLAVNCLANLSSSLSQFPYPLAKELPSFLLSCLNRLGSSNAKKKYKSGKVKETTAGWSGKLVLGR